MYLEAIDTSTGTTVQLKCTNQGLLTYLYGLISGENQTLNRLMGGGFWLKSTPITTSTTTVIKSGVGAFAGLISTNAGTGWSATVYDNTAASGTVLVPSTTVALGRFTSGYLGSGEAVMCDTGITVVTSGTAGSLYALYV